MRALFFTPTQRSRELEPFLDVCRESHARVAGISERLFDRRIPLGSAYQFAIDYAFSEGFEAVLCIEDDEEPAEPVFIVRNFQEAARQFPAEGLFVGVKRLRAGNHPYVPFIWKFRNNPGAIGEKPYAVDQTHPDMNREAFLVCGATTCTPMMLKPAWFKAQRIRIAGGWGSKGGEYDRAEGKENTGPWDSRLADDLYERRLSFVVVPRVYCRHWDVDTKTVIE